MAPNIKQAAEDRANAKNKKSAPNSLINKKRGRPPKNPPKPPVSESDSTPTLATAPNPQDSSSSSKAPTVVERAGDPKSYSGVSQIDHGLSFPVFEPNNYFATDLFSN